MAGLGRLAGEKKRGKPTLRRPGTTALVHGGHSQLFSDARSKFPVCQIVGAAAGRPPRWTSGRPRIWLKNTTACKEIACRLIPRYRLSSALESGCSRNIDQFGNTGRLRNGVAELPQCLKMTLNRPRECFARSPRGCRLWRYGRAGPARMQANSSQPVRK